MTANRLINVKFAVNKLHYELKSAVFDSTVVCNYMMDNFRWISLGGRACLDMLSLKFDKYFSTFSHSVVVYLGSCHVLLAHLGGFDRLSCVRTPIYCNFSQNIR